MGFSMQSTGSADNVRCTYLERNNQPARWKHGDITADRIHKVQLRFVRCQVELAAIRRPQDEEVVAVQMYRMRLCGVSAITCP